jgi:hypothetical protein
MAAKSQVGAMRAPATACPAAVSTSCPAADQVVVTGGVGVTGVVGDDPPPPHATMTRMIGTGRSRRRRRTNGVSTIA